MNALIDTNVILNILTKRNDIFFVQSEKIIYYATKGLFHGFVAMHSLPIMWYVLRKGNSENITRQLIEMVCNIFEVATISHESVKEAIKNKDFHDFEDCLQDECACAIGADYLVTCNMKDFSVAKTNVVTPDKFLQIIEHRQSDI